MNRLSTVRHASTRRLPSLLNESLTIPHDPILSAPASSQINLIEFLSLSGCALQINLGRRSTNWGAPPLAQRLLLDLEFFGSGTGMHHAAQERGDTELANTLEQASKERLDLLPMSLYQSILQGPEWQLFWERPTTLGVPCQHQ